MNKILRICKGNTFALKIDVEKLKNSNGSIVKEDFNLQTCKEIKVLLSSKGKTIEAEFTAVGKTLTIKGDKGYEVGMYDLELVCVDADDLDLRFSKSGVFSIVRNTEEADIPVGVEFGIDNYYLGVISVTYATSVEAVTSVGASVPTGFKVSGSPITGSGIIAISFAEGYSLPTTSKQAEWDAKQDKLTAGENVTISNGVISATDTKIPDSKQAEWSGKQDKLIEGDNIEIDSQNKISADLSSCAKNSDITDLQDEIDANASDIDALEGEVDAIKTRTTTAEGNISTLQGKVSSLETSVAGKQDTLTAGANVTIEGGVISATDTKIPESKQTEWSNKQDKLIAGSNITIVGNTISATGGGSGGSIIYKGTIGTGGTITTLPTASSENAGWQYKVITAGTYSGIEANINDSFISNGSTWTLAKGSEDISKIGDLNDLTTSVKTSVVAAVNEVNKAIVGQPKIINTIIKNAVAGDSLVSSKFDCVYSAGTTLTITIEQDLGDFTLAGKSLKLDKKDGGSALSKTLKAGTTTYTLSEDVVSAWIYTSATASQDGYYKVYITDNVVIPSIDDKLNLKADKSDLTSVETTVTDVSSRIETVEKRDAAWVLPSYYDTYLPTKIAETREDIRNASGRVGSFLFFTDSHWNANQKNSPKLACEILKSGVTDLVIWGGDICMNTGTNDQVIESINAISEFNKIISPYGQLLRCRGNHDLNGPAEGQTSGEDYTLSNYAVKHILMNRINCINYDDKTTYYYDDDATYVRYVICECFFYPSNEHLTWIANAIIDRPSNYRIVIVNHDGVIGATSSWGSKHTNFNSLIIALCKKSSYTISSKTFDFGGIETIAVMSGHTHNDSQSLINGVAHIGVAADAKLGDDNWLGKKASTRGTQNVREQLMDMVVFQDGIIKCHRIGGGYDRIFYRTPLSASISQSVTLSTTLQGDITWFCYNSELNDPNDYVEQNATIINGTFVASVAGQYTCSAMDADGKREFFNVIVS